MSPAGGERTTAAATQREKRVDVIARKPATPRRGAWLLAGIPALVVVALTWWGIDFG